VQTVLRGSHALFLQTALFRHIGYRCDSERLYLEPFLNSHSREQMQSIRSVEVDWAFMPERGARRGVYDGHTVVKKPTPTFTLEDWAAPLDKWHAHYAAKGLRRDALVARPSFFPCGSASVSNLLELDQYVWKVRLWVQDPRKYGVPRTPGVHYQMDRSLEVKESKEDPEIEVSFGDVPWA
jgi:hypothetical protein